MSYRFHEGYAEDLRLRDGRIAHLRLVRPGDKALLREGLRRMSFESRYRRFLGAREDLRPDELAYLTEVDGVDHFAIGALADRPGGGVEGLGIARFVRLADDPDSAEAAIAVIDDAQGLGLGRALMSRLCAAAQERGIRRLHCLVLADNSPMRKLLDAVAPGTTYRIEEGVLYSDSPLAA